MAGDEVDEGAVHFRAARLLQVEDHRRGVGARLVHDPARRVIPFGKGSVRTALCSTALA